VRRRAFRARAGGLGASRDGSQELLVLQFDIGEVAQTGEPFTVDLPLEARDQDGKLYTTTMHVAGSRSTLRWPLPAVMRMSMLTRTTRSCIGRRSIARWLPR